MNDVPNAEMLLFMLHAGTLNLCIAENRNDLARIIKEWQLLSVKSDELVELYDSLTAHERRVMTKLLSVRNRISFSDIQESVSNDAIEKTLKRIRKKLDKTQWWFEISRARLDVCWILRDGKKIK